jgi:hypothetical protein
MLPKDFATFWQIAAILGFEYVSMKFDMPDFSLHRRAKMSILIACLSRNLCPNQVGRGRGSENPKLFYARFAWVRGAEEIMFAPRTHAESEFQERFTLSMKN